MKRSPLEMDFDTRKLELLDRSRREGYMSELSR